jgi:hypothetical protein
MFTSCDTVARITEYHIRIWMRFWPQWYGQVRPMSVSTVKVTFIARFWLSVFAFLINCINFDPTTDTCTCHDRWVGCTWWAHRLRVFVLRYLAPLRCQLSRSVGWRVSCVVPRGSEPAFKFQMPLRFGVGEGSLRNLIPMTSNTEIHYYYIESQLKSKLKRAHGN